MQVSKSLLSLIERKQVIFIRKRKKNEKSPRVVTRVRRRRRLRPPGRWGYRWSAPLFVRSDASSLSQTDRQTDRPVHSHSSLLAERHEAQAAPPVDFCDRSVSLSVGNERELWKNGRLDRDAV